MIANYEKGRGYEVPFTIIVDGCAFTTVSEQLVCVEVPLQSQSGNDEPKPDRNGKRTRTPKLPQLNRHNWWNR